ncbi:MAG: SDR family oxidoreductase, partial [Nannocystaceae bacterium]
MSDPLPLAQRLGSRLRSGAGLLALTCDVSDAGQVDELFANVKAKCGRLDVLFNNAGIGAPRV